MATLTLDKPETVRKAVDRLTDAGETLMEDAKVLKARAVELVDDSRLAARKAYVRGRHEFEDLRDETALRVRKAPFTAIGVTFGVGVLLGAVVGWAARRPRG